MFASVPPATGVSELEAAVCSDAEVLAPLVFSVSEAEVAWVVSLALLLSAATLPLNGVKQHPPLARAFLRVWDVTSKISLNRTIYRDSVSNLQFEESPGNCLWN